MGFFSVIALIMFAAILFGFSDLSYWWLAAPLIAELILFVGIISFAASVALKTEDISFKEVRAALKAERNSKKAKARKGFDKFMIHKD